MAQGLSPTIRCGLNGKDDDLLMSAPAALDGQIEARYLGLLRAPSTTAWVRFVVDLDQTETERLPHARETVIDGVPLN